MCIPYVVIYARSFPIKQLTWPLYVDSGYHYFYGSVYYMLLENILKLGIFIS